MSFRESSILNFRQLLVKRQLTAQLPAEINAHPSKRWLLLGKGTIIDAPSSTESARKKLLRLDFDYRHQIRFHYGSRD